MWNSSKNPKVISILRRYYIFEFILTGVFQFLEEILYFGVLFAMFGLGKNLEILELAEYPYPRNKVYIYAGLLAFVELLRLGIHVLRVRILASLEQKSLKMLGAVFMRLLQTAPSFPGFLNASETLLFDIRQIALALGQSHTRWGGILRILFVVVAITLISGMASVFICALIIIVLPILLRILKNRQQFRQTSLARGELRRSRTIELLSGSMSLHAMGLENCALDGVSILRCHEEKAISKYLSFTLIVKMITTITTPISIYTLIQPFITTSMFDSSIISHEEGHITPAEAMFVVFLAYSLRRPISEVTRSLWCSSEAFESIIRLDAFIELCARARKTAAGIKSTRVKRNSVFKNLPLIMCAEDRVDQLRKTDPTKLQTTMLDDDLEFTSEDTGLPLIGARVDQTPFFKIPQGVSFLHPSSPPLVALARVCNPYYLQPLKQIAFYGLPINIEFGKAYSICCEDFGEVVAILKTFGGELVAAEKCHKNRDLPILHGGPGAQSKPNILGFDQFPSLPQTPSRRKYRGAEEAVSPEWSEVLSEHSQRVADQLRNGERLPPQDSMFRPEFCSLPFSGTIGLCLTNPWILDGTLFENITFLCDKPPSIELAQKIIEFTRLFPENDLSTLISKNGMKLTPQMRQSIGLARILLVKPSIIVFEGALPSFLLSNSAAMLNTLLDGKDPDLSLAGSSVIFVGVSETLKALNRLRPQRVEHNSFSRHTRLRRQQSICTDTDTFREGPDTRSSTPSLSEEAVAPELLLLQEIITKNYPNVKPAQLFPSPSLSSEAWLSLFSQENAPPLMTPPVENETTSSSYSGSEFTDLLDLIQNPKRTAQYIGEALPEKKYEVPSTGKRKKVVSSICIALKGWFNMFFALNKVFMAVQLVLHLAVAFLECYSLNVLTTWSEERFSRYKRSESESRKENIVLIFWAICVIITDCLDKKGGMMIGKRFHQNFVKSLFMCHPRDAHMATTVSLGNRIVFAMGAGLDELDTLAGFSLSVVLYFFFRFFATIYMLWSFIGPISIAVIVLMILVSFSMAIPYVLEVNSKQNSLSVASEVVLSALHSLSGGKLELENVGGTDKLVSKAYDAICFEANERKNLNRKLDLALSTVHLASIALSSAQAVFSISFVGITSLKAKAASILMGIVTTFWLWETLSGFFLSLPITSKVARSAIALRDVTQDLPLVRNEEIAHKFPIIASADTGAQRHKSDPRMDIVNIDMQKTSVNLTVRQGREALMSPRIRNITHEPMFRQQTIGESSDPTQLSSSRKSESDPAATSYKHMRRFASIPIHASSLTINRLAVFPVNSMLSTITQLRLVNFRCEARSVNLLWSPLLIPCVLGDGQPIISSSGVELLVPTLLNFMGSAVAQGEILVDSQDFLKSRKLMAPDIGLFCIPAEPILPSGFLSDILTDGLLSNRIGSDAFKKTFSKRMLDFMVAWIGLNARDAVPALTKDSIIESGGLTLPAYRRQLIYILRAYFLGCRIVVIEDCGGDEGLFVFRKLRKLAALLPTKTFTILMISSRHIVQDFVTFDHIWVLYDGETRSVRSFAELTDSLQPPLL
eukprot:gnl/Chilomastix_cuspidata/2175.p1 GENE.gnl/Chilomastix_cuspidata/2175~~gnl/Chilomastix_cuspidata/2175.p1  ORF type:complete len:1595 (-),score=539.92 gnl/Chilomastix_cuspidata/2175:265-4932(-)